ncbi:hypothetical protein SUGI_0500230 [Cryptomeria japonica]|nr:hypothetical protein SUGI_0500230 [Cryptomeria japonica]
MSIHDYFNPPLYQLDIPEVKGNSSLSNNDLYESVQQYLESLQGIAPRQTIFPANNSCNVCFSPANDKEVEDFFQGLTLRWKHTAETLQSNKERQSFTLKLPKADKAFIFAYINHITRRVEDLSRANKEIMLYNNKGDAIYGYGWTSIPFKHSSTLDTITLDPPLKRKILTDLYRFK